MSQNETAEILQLLEERRPAGIITINPTLHARWRLIEDFDLDIPSVTVSAYSGLQAVEATRCNGTNEDREPPVSELHVKCDRQTAGRTLRADRILCPL